MMFHSVSLVLFILVLTVSFNEADYQFTIRFYEFRNPLGLQCGVCESGGPPTCCDDLLQKNCIDTPPRTCDTRFRFMLRPFEAPVETAPSRGFPNFTPSNGGNSDTFIEGPGGFLALQNPFTIVNSSKWTGRIQFFIDALDRVVSTSGLTETEFLINRFPINLELELNVNLTERTTYTGIYNISGQGFDMSFRVQCSENSDGPNCARFCEPVESVYTCDSEGNIICVENGRDPATNCTTCLQGWNPNTNCTTCLYAFSDIKTNCILCLPGRDIASNCATCLPGYDPLTNCTECLPNVQCQLTQTTSTAAQTTISTHSSGMIQNSNICDDCLLNSVITPAVLGGTLGLSVIMIVILIIVVVVLITKIRGTSLSLQPSLREGEGEKDVEMKPNSLCGPTSGSESIVIKPNEVYGVSVPAEPSRPATYYYVNP